MAELSTVNSGLAALIAGVIISPHCACMCGPLSCMLLKTRSPQDAFWTKVAYHASRTLAYIIIGAIAGGLGMGLLSIFQLSSVQYFPWFLIAILLGYALGLERFLPKLKKLQRFFSKLSAHVRQLPGPTAGSALGLMTPFLPCGPLYTIFWIALLSGSPLFGAELCFGFAIGTVPLLWLGQSTFQRFQSKWGPQSIARIQRIAAVLAAGALIWRLTHSTGPLQAECCRTLAQF
ncbi:MAG TPA: sulfite exporter TauE/SafE family protein [Opitutae bacterium]|nr:sulfite exporter TauE/SafE family protein [Opitutae bacterium]|tara:strand:- start:1977 stop:2675 length:699 start_codon:yes stop_codon:yes gene_type:complete